MADYILSHDIGTTGNKATLFDREGQLLASHFHGYQTYYPRTNWAEQDPHDWWESVQVSTKKLIEEAKIEAEEIQVVSFSGQMMGCVPVDSDGVPLRRAIIWADQRGTRQIEELTRKVGMEKIYKVTGHRASSTYSAAKIMWIRDQEPKIYENAHKFLQAKDYIAFKLTGVFATDYSDASGTNLFDLRKKKWSEKLLGEANISEDKLPLVYPSTYVIGEITSSIAEKTGLKEGTPVVIGGGDGSCAATGAGVVSKGSAYNYLGASSWIALATKEPIYDPDMKTFNWVHLDPTMYSPCGTMQSAGGSLEWIKESICQNEVQAAEMIGEDPYQIIDLMILKSPPGAKGLLFLPYLIGERSPYWNPNVRGAFVGLTKRHTKKDMLRAVVEGVCFNLRIILEAFQDQGVSIEEIRVIGGGVKSEAWRKIMADIYEKPLIVPSYLREATSLGAAIAGGVGMEIFPNFSVVEKIINITETLRPEQQNSEIYRDLFEIFTDSYGQLLSIFNRLSELN